MREILNRIKRGELQLYLSLVQTYVEEVYFSARNNFTEEEAINLTKEIFIKLYDKIMSYMFIFDAKNYVEKNLEKISSKQGVILRKKYFNDTREVPEIVIRKTLVEISAKSNSKKRRSVMIAAPIMALIFITVITFMSQVSSSNDTHPKGTIKRIEYQAKKVYEERFNMSYSSDEKMIKIMGFHRLDGDTILVEKIDDKSYYYEVYEKDNIISSYISNGSKMRYLALTNDNELIFKVDDELVRFDMQFKLINKFSLPENLYKYSDNKRYALYKVEYKVIRIDLYTFTEDEIMSSKEDRVIKVNNDGTFITESELIEKGYQDIIEDSGLTIKIIDNQIVTLSELGVLKVIEEGSRVFAKKLAHYEDLELT